MSVILRFLRPRRLQVAAVASALLVIVSVCIWLSAPHPLHLGAALSARRSRAAAGQAGAAQMEQAPAVRTVVAVSDIHRLHLGSRLLVPPGDFLVFAGDVEVASQNDWARFLQWIAGLPHQHKVVSWGNMDQWCEDKGPDAPEWQEAAAQGVHIIRDTVAEVGGLRVLASPNTPEFYGAFQLMSEVEATQHWARVLPPDTAVDILVTHGPPYGFGDTARSRHVGDKALAAAVRALHHPPRLWVCGHIHEGRGAHKFPHPKGDILLVNAAVQYIARGHPEHQPFIIDLHTKDVTVGPPPAPQPAEQQPLWKAPIVWDNPGM